MDWGGGGGGAAYQMGHEPIRHFQNGGPIYDQFVCKWGGGGLVDHLRNRLLSISTAEKVKLRR